MEELSDRWIRISKMSMALYFMVNKWTIKKQQKSASLEDGSYEMDAASADVNRSTNETDEQNKGV